MGKVEREECIAVVIEQRRRLVLQVGAVARVPRSTHFGVGGGWRKPRTHALEVLVELLRLARQGLNNQGVPEEGALLGPLDRRLEEEGGCPAYGLAAGWEGPQGGDPRRLVDLLSRNTLNRT